MIKHRTNTTLVLLACIAPATWANDICVQQNADGNKSFIDCHKADSSAPRVALKPTNTANPKEFIPNTPDNEDTLKAKSRAKKAAADIPIKDEHAEDDSDDTVYVGGYAGRRALTPDEIRRRKEAIAARKERRENDKDDPIVEHHDVLPAQADTPPAQADAPPPQQRAKPRKQRRAASKPER